jgi:hypothetical protein
MANNQYVTITPNVLNLTEFSSFDQTFSIDYKVPENPEIPLDPVPPATYDYVYHDVRYDYSQITKLSSITVSQLSNTSFRIYGNFSDIFERSLKYANIDSSLGEVNHFGDMPSTYGALYSYTPPSVTTKSIVFNVITRPSSGPAANPPENTLHTYTVTAIISMNSTISNQYFRRFLESGAFYEKAKAAGRV